jgi:hypothetical protein
MKRNCSETSVKYEVLEVIFQEVILFIDTAMGNSCQHYAKTCMFLDTMPFIA